MITTMGKTKASKRTEVPFGTTKVACITPYQKRVYVHINDSKKHKSVTFSSDDFDEFLEVTKEIQAAIAKCKSKIKKSKSDKTKKVKKQSKKEPSSSDESEVEMSASSDSD